MKRQSKLIVALARTVLMLALSACGTETPATQAVASALPSIPEATRTPEPTFTPIDTPTIEATSTPLFTPTPFGGGAGRIAYTLCSGTEFSGPDDFIGCEIHVINVDGSNPIQLTHDQTWDCCAVWSPDGTKIAFVSFLASGSEISVMNADGSNPVRLTNNGRHNNSPSWSPDGGKIVFASNRNGYNEIYVMDADGGNPTQLTNSQDNFEPALSPDGTKIAYRRDTQIDGGIYVMNADGSNSVRLNASLFWGSAPAWSPDGTKIAFMTSFGENMDIYVMNADGSNLVQLTDDAAPDHAPAWSPDGRQIAFLSDQDGVSSTELYLMNSDGSNPTLLLPSAGTVAWLNQTQNPVIPRADCTSGWTRLQAGNHARVSQDTITPNRVRSGPSTADEVILLLHPGSVMKLMEGPVCADGLIFWKVENALIPGGMGWTTEGDGKEYWLEPYAP